MSVIAIDLGNTRIGMGLYTRAKSADPAIRIGVETMEAQLPSALEKLIGCGRAGGNPAPDGIVLASVNPPLTARVVELARHASGFAPALIGVDLDIPLRSRLADPRTVGVDRLLGALCAYVNTQQACAIISAGTALVVDCIDAEGVFLGGAIAPGLTMGAKALQAGAAQLPLASLAAPDAPQGDSSRPPAPFGRDTMEALNLGLYAAARGAVRELLERYAEHLGLWPHVVATGGDARRVLDASGLVDSFIPDLVLQGAALVWEHHHGREGEDEG